MKSKISIQRIVMTLIVLASPMLVLAQKHIDLSFDGVKTVYMAPPKGSCQIKKSNDLKTRVTLTTKYKDEQVPVYTIQQIGDSLVIREKYHPGSVSGAMPEWSLWVPDATTVIYKTGNGSINASNLNANLVVETGKGDINISQSRGVFKIASSHGDIVVTNFTLSGTSEFKAGKGDCTISLAANPNNDLTISSGWGNATLDFSGHKINARLTLQLSKRSKAVVPFQFGEGKTITEKGNSEIWTEKSISIGDSDNQILMRTGNGIVKLIK